MTNSAFDARVAFALLCVLAMIAVVCGAVYEVGRTRREAAERQGEAARGEILRDLAPPGQLRLRLFSASVWILALGSFAFAMLWLWPSAGDRVMARKFLSVVSGASLLLLVALWLLAYDLWQVWRLRRARERAFERQLETIAQLEMDRLRPPHDSSPT